MTVGSSAIAPTSAIASTTVNFNDYILTIQYLNDSRWLSDLVLDMDQANWETWSRAILLAASCQGFEDWLDGMLLQPNLATHAKAHQIWCSNDKSLRAFILSHISNNDYKHVSYLNTSHKVFEVLHVWHENLGLHAQVVLLKKVLEICFMPDVPLSKMILEISSLYKRIVAMGPINNDKLKSVLLINALNDHFENIQSNLMSLTNDPSFNSKTITCHLEQEEGLIKQHTEQGTPHTTTALTTQNCSTDCNHAQPVCTHCKWTGHLADFCIHPGGKMSG